MKIYSSKTLGAWIAVSALALGCGPFFPDTVLDHPQAALAVPPVSYLADLHKIAGTKVPKANIDARGSGSLLDQIPLELAELRGVWQQQGVDETEIARRADRYTQVRTQLLFPLSGIGMKGFPTHPDGKVDLTENPLGVDFPKAVADYVEAARLHAAGKTDDARKLWKAILDRPLAEKRLRSLWAAWMLAKTSATQDECMEWYARVEEEAKLGGTDVLGLRAAAKSWRGPRAKDPVASIHLLYESFQEGRETAALDLRAATWRLFSTKDTAVLDAAVADPVVRRLVNLDLQARMDGLPSDWIIPDDAKAQYDDWFAALERNPEGATEDAARIAWAFYSAGKYEESRKWLSLVKEDSARSLWLQAKFDLRDGNDAAASKHLSQAVRLRSAETDWNPSNHYNEERWFDATDSLQALRDGRLLAESSVVSLAQGEYISALDSLRKAGYWRDAAYVAENVISADALMKYVREAVPEWRANEGDDAATDGRYYNMISEPENRLRWVLARRLNREKRFKEAREFIPPSLLATLDRYIALDKARRSGRNHGQVQAAIVWEQVLMHRHYGAELFSTEAWPDGGAYEWSFPMASDAVARTRKDGWRYDYQAGKFLASETPEDKAIPAVSPEEMLRVRRYGVKIKKRFHYRYAAADLAWDAAKLLPANDPQLARLYITAGSWLASSDPASADRFYQALVRRCAETDEGKAAEETRWFPRELKELRSMEALPKEFARNLKTEPPW